MVTKAKKTRAQERADEAEKLHQQLKAIWKKAFEIPSFAGKSKFLDRFRPILTRAELLSLNLKTDAGEEG